MDPETIEVDESWINEVLAFLENVRVGDSDEQIKARANTLRIQFGKKG